jgi:hypothetical protein
MRPSVLRNSVSVHVVEVDSPTVVVGGSPGGIDALILVQAAPLGPDLVEPAVCPRRGCRCSTDPDRLRTCLSLGPLRCVYVCDDLLILIDVGRFCEILLMN